MRSTFSDLFATGGQYTFATVDDFLSNCPSRFVQRFNGRSEASNDVLGLFIQDEWKIASNVTLSFGVRWDNESILDDTDNFSPRLAVAWDPFGGKLFRGLNLESGRLDTSGFVVLQSRASAND